MKKILLLLLLLVPSTSFGAWTPTESFDTYSNGNSISGLSGGTGWNGNWVLNSGTVTITNGEAQSGSLSVFSSTPSGNYERAITAVSEGEFSFYIRKPAQTQSWYVALMNGTDYRIDIGFENADIVVYHGAGWSRETLVLSANTNQWYKISVLLNGDNTFKIKIDSGSYSSNFNYITNGSITLFQVYEGGSAGSGAYFDTIEPISAGGGGGTTTPWCGVDVLSTTTPSCGMLGVDACGNIVCMATTTADITAISVTLLAGFGYLIALLVLALSLWIWYLLVR